MRGQYLPLLASLLALLVGIFVGKAWERYKLRDGRWFDRRRLRDTPHYMLGLTFLLQGQVDAAIEELTKAASTDADALELEMILGNLLREKGHVAKAIAIHQVLLQRPTLNAVEHAHVLLCLGLDYRRAGFIERAKEAFLEVRRLDPANRYALQQLQRLYEEQRDWPAALKVREDHAALNGAPTPEDRKILGFLHAEIGQAQRTRGDAHDAQRAFMTALDVDDTAAPAYVHLGDLRESAGDVRGAIEAWAQLASAVPHRAGLVLERLERGYLALGQPERFSAYCTTRLAEAPEDWRTRLALARHLSSRDQHETAFNHLLEALTINPHGLAIHQAAWATLVMLDRRADLVSRYLALTRDALFYLDPHVCVRCRYRSTELLWLCPQCHEWDTFIEERVAPAPDSATFAAVHAPRAPSA